MSQIYALCDNQLLTKFNISLSQYLLKIQKYNIKYIQYRDKINSIDIKKENLLYIKQNTQIPLIINDNIELLDYADGLHIGQEDLEYYLHKLNLDTKVEVFMWLRTNYPNKIFGLSTHNKEEILEANRFDLDYIGLGSYKNTNTKDVTTILGDNISELAKLSLYPVGAIGGVKVDDKIANITYNVVGSDLINPPYLDDKGKI